MSVCTTCLQRGIRDYSEHDCPGLGDIHLTRQLGRGLRVDTAPPRARMPLTVLADHGHGLAMQDADLINIADQVLYQVVGYDAESAALVLELVEDWRSDPAAKVRALPERELHDTIRKMARVDPAWFRSAAQAMDRIDGAANARTVFGGTACTPIPDATLRQMSEVPDELLTEQQLGRPENALERLRLAREALIRDGYFTADEVGPDLAPRIVEWLAHHRQQLEQARADTRTLGAGVQKWHDIAAHHQHWGQRRWNAWKSARARAQRMKAELDRLTAGEESGWDPLVVPTPGQWIARWNRANAVERLDVAKRVIDYTATASTCFEMNHVRRLEENRQAWVALARVRDVLAEMERITGARHWARILRKAVEGEPVGEAVAAEAVRQMDAEAHATEDQLRRTRIELEHWQTVTVPGLRDERDKARATLREVLAVFATVTSPTSGVPMGYQAPPIHPNDMDRWRTSLDPRQGAAVSGYPTPGMRKKMQDAKPGTPPPGPAGASSANGRRILVDAPDGAVVLAARHLDATEGPVQVGATVTTATRSAITTVLGYVAKAHNSPAAPADEQRAAVGRVRALHARNPHSGTCEHCSAGDYPDYAVPYPCATIRALSGEESS